MLTNKTKKDFEKWWIEQPYTFKPLFGSDIDLDDVFQELPFSMQIGVYQEFFDSVGVYSNSYYCPSVKAYSWDVYYNKGEGLRCGDYTNTRTEAQKAAIEKANEIFNNK